MQLLPHQIEDAQFLASKKFAGNFSGMGSGKTLSALEAVNLVIAGTGQVITDPNKIPQPLVCIVAPPIALHMWQSETERHCGLSTQILKTGTTKINDANVVIMSYEIATKRVAELKECRPIILICDESHALKSVKAKRTKALLGKGGLAGFCSYSWMLTGTPQTRWNDDLFPFLCRAGMDKLADKLGTVNLSRYLLRYCVVKTKYFGNSKYPAKLVVGNRNTDELRSLLFNSGNPLAVRRELADVWDAMPPLTKSRLVVPLEITPELRQLLKEHDSKTDDELAQDLKNQEPALATLRRELGVAKVKHSASEIADRLEAGNGPFLVGAWHTSVIDALYNELDERGWNCDVLDGRTSSTKKKLLQDEFNAGEIDVLIGQIAAMGVSLNLQQGSNKIIVVEEDWSPSVMDQFYARLHRIGQKNHVHVDTFISDTKLDKAVGRISSAKQRSHHQLLSQKED